MLRLYKQWLRDAPVNKKFYPSKFFTLFIIIFVGIVSVSSVFTVNFLSKRVFTENVQSTEMLYEIVRTMYMCRVLGRDILLQPDALLRQELYKRYIQSFKNLDLQMDGFAKRLTGEKRDIFNRIIADKEIYKDSMILSADIKNEGGRFAEALNALTRVTPIANNFFGNINQFLLDEKKLMSEVLDENDTIVTEVIIVNIFINIIAVFLLFLMIRVFAKTMSNTLISLEHSVSEIANTANMKIDIPAYLFTKDEIGRIALAINKLKIMLLDYSFKDALTGGYNATAYFEELSNIFDSKQGDDSQRKLWCIMFDMNNLKQINDHHGHIDGDSAIKDAHAIMVECFSEYGKIFRVGGDEFVLILRGCSKDEIEINLEKMNSRIREVNQNRRYCFSVAWGYDEFKGTTKEDFEEYFNYIDKKMYQNKKVGKQSSN